MLTDEQRQAVLECADKVPSPWRTRFIESVIDRLFGAGADGVTDAQLAEALCHAADRLCVNVEEV